MIYGNKVLSNIKENAKYETIEEINFANEKVLYDLFMMTETTLNNLDIEAVQESSIGDFFKKIGSAIINMLKTFVRKIKEMWVKFRLMIKEKLEARKKRNNKPVIDKVDNYRDYFDILHNTKFTFDPSKVEHTINDIETTYQKLIKELKDGKNVKSFDNNLDDFYKKYSFDKISNDGNGSYFKDLFKNTIDSAPKGFIDAIGRKLNKINDNDNGIIETTKTLFTFAKPRSITYKEFSEIKIDDNINKSLIDMTESVSKLEQNSNKAIASIENKIKNISRDCESAIRVFKKDIEGSNQVQNNQNMKKFTSTKTRIIDTESQRRKIDEQCEGRMTHIKKLSSKVLRIYGDNMRFYVTYCGGLLRSYQTVYFKAFSEYARCEGLFFGKDKIEEAV